MNFNEKIEKVNQKLDQFDTEAVQEYTSGAFEAIGYKPQYIIDAVNDVFGSGNWKHIVHFAEIREVTTKKGDIRQVSVAEVSVQFMEGTAVYETGRQYGGGNVVAGNIADALKSAVTDAIGKTLSLMSVGKKAYRGKLASEFKGKAQKVAHPQESSVVTVDEEIANMSSGRFQKRESTAFKKGNGFKKPDDVVQKETVKEEAKVETSVAETADKGNGADASQAPEVAKAEVTQTPSKAEGAVMGTPRSFAQTDGEKPRTEFTKSKFASLFDEGSSK